MYYRDNAFFRKLPIRLFSISAVVFNVLVIVRLTEDTTLFYAVAFGASSTLSGLCFRMSSSIPIKEADHKRRMAYAGERLLHGALLFLIGFALKYAMLEAYNLNWEAVSSVDWLTNIEWLHFSTEWFRLPLISGFSFIGVICFGYGIQDSCNALAIINEILWQRSYNEKDWDDSY